MALLDVPNKDTNTHGTRRRVLMGMARTRRPLRTGGMPCLSRYSALRSWGGPWCSSLASPCSSLSHNHLCTDLGSYLNQCCCTEYLSHCLSYLGKDTVSDLVGFCS